MKTVVSFALSSLAFILFSETTTVTTSAFVQQTVPLPLTKTKAKLSSSHSKSSARYVVNNDEQQLHHEKNEYEQQQQQKSSLIPSSSSSSRRNMLHQSLMVMTTVASSSSIITSKSIIANAEEPDTRNLTPFNTLTFNYRGSSFGGLDASTLDEPSIPYSDFLSKLDSGDVLYVEFLAPDGDVAYATLKPTGGDDAKTNPSRIRIGEGYPIEQHDGWSSPAFAVRSVKEKGVPYKFIVPGLEKYKNM